MLHIIRLLRGIQTDREIAPLRAEVHQKSKVVERKKQQLRILTGDDQTLTGTLIKAFGG